MFGTILSLMEVYLTLTAEHRLWVEHESKHKTIIDVAPFPLPLY